MLKPRLLPRKSACDYIGVKATKFNELAAQGRIDLVKIGKKVCATMESLDRLVDNLPRAEVRLPKAA